MNGDSQANGAAPDLERIIQALQAIYDPRSSNEIRREATVWLDNVKSHPTAPAIGYSLTSDATKSVIIRYFGLALLEHSIRYRWDEISSDDTQRIKQSIVELAQQTSDDDALMLRNKIAQLWAELAKRMWLSQWLDMDQQLCELWHRSFAHQDIVLYVLETLSEEVFTREESAAAASRGQDLGKACIEIFTPAKDLAECFPDREVLGLRFGTEGWIQRLAEMMEWCYTSSDSNPNRVRECLVRVLSTVRSILPWIALKSVISTNTINMCCRALESGDVSVRLASVTALHALYHRSNYRSADIVDLVCPLVSSEGIGMLKKTYEQGLVDPEDIDDERYTALKKLTEVFCALAAFVEQRPDILCEHGDVPEFLNFLVQVLQNPSMVVSIPVLYIWTKLLASKQIGSSDMVAPLIGTLLDLCKSRLIKYEALTRESNDQTLMFLAEDFDTVPERHAFVGNYRRFCMEVVERIVRRNPFEAMRYILTQADGVMQTLLITQGDIDRFSYSSSTPQVLGLDAQTTVVMTAMKGYLKYVQTNQANKGFPESDHRAMIRDLESWCSRFSLSAYQDPSVQRRILQFVVDITVSAIPSDSPLPKAIVEQILTADHSGQRGDAAYDETHKELQSAYPRELQKLATRFSDALLPALPAIEEKLRLVIALPDLEKRIKLDYQSFLFIVIQRCSSMTMDAKAEKSQGLIEPVVQSWRNPAFKAGLTSFQSFCDLLGLDAYPVYFLKQNAQNVSDWASRPLDAEGIRIRDRIAQLSDDLPLQATRSLLSASTEHIRPDSAEHRLSKAQWESAIPTILPDLLRLVGHAHAFNNPSNWEQFSPAMPDIVKRTLVDRVWQSGISLESRDDFYARVRNSKDTLEGLASAIRASVRAVRELTYWVLHCSCQFGDAFYSHKDLPEPMAHALYENAHTLSAHQLSTLLRLSTALTDSCPPQYRPFFLPPLLSTLFKQLDMKTSMEWDGIAARLNSNADEETLDREMKAESVLRQLTHSAVLLVANLLDHRQPADSSTGSSTRSLILASPGVLEPLVLFCNHALRMHDTRSCSIITRVLRHLIPEFADAPRMDHTTAAQVREFFSTEVLKACITSLNEPYFADLQKDLAWLIASIVSLYSPKTETPRKVLLSLPGMTEQRVDSHIHQMLQTTSERAQRGIVLALLQNVRGVSIYEQGKLSKEMATGKSRTTMQQQYAVPMEQQQHSSVIRGGTPELGDLFG